MPAKKRSAKARKKIKTKSVRSVNSPKNASHSAVYVSEGKQKQRRKLYDPKDLRQALRAVSGGVSFRKAATAYKVPVTSLFRAVKDPEKMHKTSGPPTVLTEEEEKTIVDWILYRAERGSPVTKVELLDCVQAYMVEIRKKNPFTNGRPGRHWYEGFTKRHPNLRVRTAQHLSLVRASVTEQDLRGWFSEIQVYLESKNLVNIHPSRVFNCDETNIQLVPKPEKVITQKGARSVYKVVDGSEKESLTALFMYNAEGVRAPPMIMYAYKKDVPKKIIESCPRDWGIGISDNGWMTTETFYEYIANVFYPWLLKQNIDFPIVLYSDGHSSHMTIPLVRFCRERKIELISLYPNATHVMQPLDIALFHPFKDIWRRTVAKWKTENNHAKIKKEQFAVVLKKTLDEFTDERKIVQSGFRAAGLMPFNPEAVDFNVLQKKNKKSQLQVNQPVEKVSEDEIENKKRHLQSLENNLSNDLLLEFKAAEVTGLWINDLEQKGLFEYWLNVKKSTESSGKVKPRIVKIDMLVNHEVHFVQSPRESSVQNVNEGVNPNKEVVLIEISSSPDDALMELNTNGNIPLQLNKSEESPLDFSFLDIDVANITSEQIVIADDFTKPSELSVPQDEYFIGLENKLCGTSNENSSMLANNMDAAPSTLCKNDSLPSDSKETVACLDLKKKDNAVQEQKDSQENDAHTITNCTSPNDEKSDDLYANKENSDLLVNQGNDVSPQKRFAKAFTLPPKYLPKKKRAKLQASGKCKTPMAGTSDSWWNDKMEQEEKETLKEKKAAQKKILQEQKKKLLEEKKRLTKEMQEISKKIKLEKI